jgi:CIC family chloride channel protein
MLAAKLFPDIISSPGAYSLIGMGAFFAAVVNGPITAIVLLVEMTRDIQLVLPLMTAVVAATLTARAFTRDSIYTLRLRRSGVDIHQEEVVPLMKTITVAEAMTTDFPSVSHRMPVSELLTKLAQTGHHGFPVVDDEGRLYGVVTLADVEASRGGDIPDLKVSDIATKSPIVAYPDQSIYDALLKLGAKDVGRMPVVDRKDRTKLLGVLRRHDIIRAYKEKLVDKAGSG